MWSRKTTSYNERWIMKSMVAGSLQEQLVNSMTDCGFHFLVNYIALSWELCNFVLYQKGQMRMLLLRMERKKGRKGTLDMQLPQVWETSRTFQAHYSCLSFLPLLIPSLSSMVSSCHFLAAALHNDPWITMFLPGLLSLIIIPPSSPAM